MQSDTVPKAWDDGAANKRCLKRVNILRLAHDVPQGELMQPRGESGCGQGNGQVELMCMYKSPDPPQHAQLSRMISGSAAACQLKISNCIVCDQAR